MRIPKNCDVQLKTNDGTVELHINAAITTKSQAAELISCIRQVSGALESEKRGPRRPKVAAVA